MGIQEDSKSIAGISERMHRRSRSLKNLIIYGAPAILASLTIAACGTANAASTSTTMSKTSTQAMAASTSMAAESCNSVADGGGSTGTAKALLKGSSHSETEQQACATTFLDYENASGVGPGISQNTKIVVDCFESGPLTASSSAEGNLSEVHLPNGKTEKADHQDEWYHIVSPTAYAGKFVASNTFDNGDTTGPITSQPTHDINVPTCPAS
jgi:hypothetical protein